MHRLIVLGAVLLLCITVHAQDTAGTAAINAASAHAPLSECPQSPGPDPPSTTGYKNCQTAPGSVCRAECAVNTLGVGLEAVCGVDPATNTASWKITGFCSEAAAVAAATNVNSCQNNCGKRSLIDMKSNLPCHCDYWCNLYNDCCGGMNAVAAAAKDAACPDMAPEATNLADLLTCSNQRGVLAGVDACASYKPGNCWCDKFCSAAGDCCSNCPAGCPATCPASTTTTEVQSIDTSDEDPIRGSCGAEAANKLALRRNKELLLSPGGGITPADFTQNFEGQCQRCQDALIQTDLSTTTITIPTYVAGVGLGKEATQYSASRASDLIKGVNAAYARSGFQFDLVKYVDNFAFTSQDTLDGNDCLSKPVNPGCERCRIYRQIVPASSQGSKALVIYMIPYPTKTGAEIILGASYRAQSIYKPSPTSNAIAISCIDGLWGLTFPDNAPGGPAFAVKRDTATVVHEIGHWLGLNHPWNEDQDTTLTNAQLCARQLGSSANNFRSIAFGFTDGVRDTPPQLPMRFRMNGKFQLGPQFFNCNADGSFKPYKKGPPISCNGAVTGPTNKYYNNFNNVMSYYIGSCNARQQAKTFSAGQLARMRCVYSCYRENQCGTGSFFC